MNLGDWQLDTVSGGRMLLDGGTMFGVVPKVLWQRSFPADEFNRIQAATHCVLARNGDHTLLIDTGYGGKCSRREMDALALEPGEPLLQSLCTQGVTPDQIDLVVLSHLHFDHAGGGVRRDPQGRLVPTFPRARYLVQQHEWETALSNAPELEGAYPTENLLPLKDAGQLELIEGDVPIVPGLRTLVTGGHTAAHQALVLESAGQAAIYIGDLCPTSCHVRRFWCMAYDTHPLVTRRRKPEILGRAADEGWWVLLDHDPNIAACRLARDPKREFVVAETRATL
jgi:glyoxylase-like metal-dependent hydrolase (beta-lactamase superfamily II)